MDRDLTPLSFRCQSQEFLLLPEKAIFWIEEKALILSDLHLGKAGHFRKNGIPIPSTIHFQDLDRLSLLIKRFEPEKIFCLGDLFHSDLNSEWTDFGRWLSLYNDLEFVLVRGNHDILDQDAYDQLNMLVVEKFDAGPFVFTHQEEKGNAGYNISGHVHPGVKIRGPGKQALRLPCYYFSSKKALLPAFGNFTGTFPIKPGREDQVFGILENKVVGLVRQNMLSYPET